MVSETTMVLKITRVTETKAVEVLEITATRIIREVKTPIIAADSETRTALIRLLKEAQTVVDSEVQKVIQPLNPLQTVEDSEELPVAALAVQITQEAQTDRTPEGLDKILR